MASAAAGGGFFGVAGRMRSRLGEHAPQAVERVANESDESVAGVARAKSRAGKQPRHVRDVCSNDMGDLLRSDAMRWNTTARDGMKAGLSVTRKRHSNELHPAAVRPAPTAPGQV